MSGDDLRAWQAHMGMTQLEAAEAIGVSLATYKRYLAGDVPRTVALACAAIKAGLGMAQSKEGATMTITTRLQYVTIRTRVVDGKPLIGLKHTAKGEDGSQIKHDWIEMPPEDVMGLIKTLQDTLAELDKNSRPAGHEVGNG